MCVPSLSSWLVRVFVALPAQFLKLNTSYLSMLMPLVDLQVIIRQKVFGNRYWLTTPKDALTSLQPIPHERMFLESIPQGYWEEWAKLATLNRTVTMSQVVGDVPGITRRRFDKFKEEYEDAAASAM